jgi:ribosome-associated translation inhibitor RaiA
MQIEINAADGVEHSPALDRHIQDKLARVERQFGDHLTRIRAYLKDVNAGKGAVHQCCHIEARPAHRDPVVVEAMAASDAYRAAGDAADKRVPCRADSLDFSPGLAAPGAWRHCAASP